MEHYSGFSAPCSMDHNLLRLWAWRLLRIAPQAAKRFRDLRSSKSAGACFFCYYPNGVLGCCRARHRGSKVRLQRKRADWKGLRGDPMTMKPANNNDEHSWESVHVCPRCCKVINLCELDMRAITTGIVICPSCEWSGQIEIQIVDQVPRKKPDSVR